MEVIKIRKWKPQKGDSSEYKEEMRRLQKDYALPYEIIQEDEEYEEEFQKGGIIYGRWYSHHKGVI